jgi:hypothetical protein
VEWVKKWVNGDRVWVWVLRIIGLAGIIWETFFDNHDRPQLLILFGGMIGVGSISKLVKKNGVDQTT